MYYTYTINLPTQDPVANARKFVKLPRSILLPPYLKINPYFVEFTDSIDQIFDAPIEAKVKALSNLRNVWATSKTTEETIASGHIVPIAYWGGPDRATVVKQVNLLGLRLIDAGLLSDTSYRTMARFIGQFWFEKGRGSLIDFLNFCTNTGFSMVTLWTNDYVNFLAEGHSGIGATIYSGGSWYPTTHVQLRMHGLATTTDIQVVASFFYEVANYNLVLDSINQMIDMDIVNCTLTAPIVPNATAKIVATGVSSVCFYNIPSQLPV